MTNTFRAFKERSLRLLTYEIFYQSGEETRPDQQKDNDLDRSLRLLTFDTFHQSDEKTWPDQQKDSDQDKYKDNDNDNDEYI